MQPAVRPSRDDPSDTVARSYVLLFAVLIASLAILVLVPYLRWNQLLQWDSIGHYASAHYIKESLFPRYSGWNPHFFAGFAQGTFYPPLFHYLVALLGFVMPLKLAFKIVVAISVLATPAAFCYAARCFEMKPARATVATLGMMTLLDAPLIYSFDNNFVGGTFASTFWIGLVANALALPLLFTYMGSLVRTASTGRFTFSTLLFAAVILCHTLTAIAAASWLAFLIVYRIARREPSRALLLHTLFAALITAFWTVPFLVYLPGSDGEKISLRLGSGSFLILGLGLTLVILLYVRSRLAAMTPLAGWFVFMTIALLTLNFVDLPVHIYRLVLCPVLVVPMLIVQFVPRRALAPIGLAFLAVFVFYMVGGWPCQRFVDLRGPQINALDIAGGPMTGRVLALANWDDQPAPDCPHAVQHLIPLAAGTHMSKGLFVESTRNGSYLLALEKMLDPSANVWGVHVPDVGKLPKSVREDLTEAHLRNFGFASIVSPRTPAVGPRSEGDSLFTLETMRQSWRIVAEDSAAYEAPVWSARQYFAEGDDVLIHVEDTFGEIRFTVYEYPPGLERLEKARLRVGGMVHHVTRIDDRLWALDFLLPVEDTAAREFPALETIEQIVGQLPARLPQRGLLEIALDDLEDELHAVSPEFAQREYRDSPLIDIRERTRCALPGERREPVTRPGRMLFRNYRVEETPLVEPLRYYPRFVRHRWDQAVFHWFLSSRAHEVILEGAPPGSTWNPHAQVSALRVSPAQDRIAFRVTSDVPTFVLIRVSHFPKWRAYANGNRIPVLRASPYLMAIYGAGEIEMRYETLSFEVASATLSIAALVALVVFVPHRVWDRDASRTYESVETIATRSPT